MINDRMDKLSRSNVQLIARLHSLFLSRCDCGSALASLMLPPLMPPLLLSPSYSAMLSRCVRPALVGTYRVRWADALADGRIVSRGQGSRDWAFIIRIRNIDSPGPRQGPYIVTEELQRAPAGVPRLDKVQAKDESPWPLLPVSLSEDRPPVSAHCSGTFWVLGGAIASKEDLSPSHWIFPPHTAFSACHLGLPCASPRCTELEQGQALTTRAPEHGILISSARARCSMTTALTLLIECLSTDRLSRNRCCFIPERRCGFLCQLGLVVL